MRISLFLLVLIFLSAQMSLTYGQDFNEKEQRYIDSCNAILENPASHDTSVAAVYADLSGYLYVSNMDTMIPLCELALNIAELGLQRDPNEAEKRAFYRTQVTAYNNIGFIHYSKGDIETGLDFILRSFEMVERIGDKEGIATGLNNIGYIYNDQGNVEKALEYYHRSLKLEQEIGHQQGIATSLNNLGFIYDAQGDLKMALDLYLQCLEIAEKLDNKHAIASSCNNVGQLHYTLGEYDTALIYLNRAYTLHKANGNKDGVATSLSLLGNLYGKTGAIDKALEYYYQTLELRKEIEDKEGITSTLQAIASAELKKGNVELAESYGKESLLIAQELGYPINIEKAAQVLSEIYAKQGKGMKAFEMHQLFVLMKDSIRNDKTRIAMEKQQLKYEFESQKSIDDGLRANQKLLQDVAHSHALSKEKAAKFKQFLIIIAAAVLLVVVIIFMLFAYSRLKITKRQKDLIEKQKLAADHTHIQLEIKNKEILDSINYAKRIQSAILPSHDLIKSKFSESFILYMPKDIVAGDFYWMEVIGNRTLIAAADCTGHGVPGAMVSVVCNNALNRAVREKGLSVPSAILDNTREAIVKEFDQGNQDVNDGMDISLCSFEGNSLQYSGANNALWIIRDGELLETKPTKQAIGKNLRVTPFKNHEIELEKNDIIYLFTDGYADQFGGEKGKKMKSSNFKSLLISIANLPLDQQHYRLEDALELWKGDLEQLDDICIIGVKI